VNLAGIENMGLGRLLNCVYINNETSYLFGSPEKYRTKCILFNKLNLYFGTLTWAGPKGYYMPLLSELSGH
jgi:hypothetical protein